MEQMRQFPRTVVGGVSLPRILIGTNWLLGWSHRSSAQDKLITEKFDTPEKFFPVFETYMQHGINAVMGPISASPLAIDAIKYAEDKLGKKIIIIDTPVTNVNDTPEGRKSAEDTFKKSAEIGSTFCLMHHGSLEQLCNKNKRIFDRLPDYLYMKRANGLIPGLSSHYPEAVVYSDTNGYDVETYIQILNCMGFLMHTEIENVARIITNAKKPVMTIKPFAAGRVTPFVGLNFNWSVLRDIDMITVGVMSEREAAEDIEISFAALDRRYPDLAGRSSPDMNQAVLKR
ncbi:MAG: hypothetical protein FWF15_10310 [Oscillospiraceae bacterium]|nr:hypothetical protein [Oscillospiraceae bacterium]